MVFHQLNNENYTEVQSNYDGIISNSNDLNQRRIYL